jgi:hypothetical protein
LRYVDCLNVAPVTVTRHRAGRTRHPVIELAGDGSQRRSWAGGGSACGTLLTGRARYRGGMRRPRSTTAAEFPIMDLGVTVGEPCPCLFEQRVERVSSGSLHRQRRSGRLIVIEVSQLSVEDESVAKLRR